MNLPTQIGMGVPAIDIETAAALGQAPGFPGVTPGQHIDKPIHSQGSYLAAQRFGPVLAEAGGNLRETLNGIQGLLQGGSFVAPPSLSAGAQGASDPYGIDYEDIAANKMGIQAARQEMQQKTGGSLQDILMQAISGAGPAMGLQGQWGPQPTQIPGMGNAGQNIGWFIQNVLPELLRQQGGSTKTGFPSFIRG
jgi:hypothetical protein